MQIKCKPIKQLYKDVKSGFEVLSCVPIGNIPQDFHLNEYGNFTINGNNLSNLSIGQEINLQLRPAVKSKYPASYNVVGFPNVQFANGEIIITPQQELGILNKIMTKRQAESVNKAYPNFITLILNNKENEIDYKKIKNVGPVYLSSYITKIQNLYRYILFVPLASEYGIEDMGLISKLANLYSSPEALKQDLETNPYHLYIDIVQMSFKKADSLILSKHKQFQNNYYRCLYACISILKLNELSGNTYMKAYNLANAVAEIAYESIDYITQVVQDKDLISYDETHKYVALRNTYNAEKNIAENIIYRLNNPEQWVIPYEEYLNIDGLQLTNEQQKILQTIQNNNVVILTGNAGSGKSASMKALINMLEDNLKTYTMLCPTGTAAKVLSKATNRTASTIHMFLAKEMSCGEVLILEEASMIGVELLSQLLDIIPKSTKIVFICDPSQLPSISCGNIVHDILKSHKISNVNLTQIFRYNSSGLITIATDTRMGKSDNLKKIYTDYKYIEEDDKLLNQIQQTYNDLLLQGYNKNDILILSPYNKGNAGTYKINQMIQDIFNPQEFLDVSYKRQSNIIKFKIGDKVINKVNNYHVTQLDEYYQETENQMFIANGSIGTLLKCYQENGENCFAIQFEEGIAKFTEQDISNLLLGYAISIHSSQGNQVRAVIVVVSKEHKRMINKNLLYVSFTRAQNKLVVIGDTETIQEGMKINEEEKRNTWLKNMLQKNIHEI